jgi:hypothetical protein
MSNKFTAIYTESWTAGNYYQTLMKMRRVEQFDGETVADMLKCAAKLRKARARSEA